MIASDIASQILAIRPATPDDAMLVARLAALDSAPVPSGDLLLGIVDGAPLVALSLATGAVVADPFSPTAELVSMLRERAERLRQGTAPGSRRRLPRHHAPRATRRAARPFAP